MNDLLLGFLLGTAAMPILYAMPGALIAGSLLAMRLGRDETVRRGADMLRLGRIWLFWPVFMSCERNFDDMPTFFLREGP